MPKKTKSYTNTLDYLNRLGFSVFIIDIEYDPTPNLERLLGLPVLWAGGTICTPDYITSLELADMGIYVVRFSSGRSQMVHLNSAYIAHSLSKQYFFFEGARFLAEYYIDENDIDFFT